MKSILLLALAAAVAAGPVAAQPGRFGDGTRIRTLERRISLCERARQIPGFRAEELHRQVRRAERDLRRGGGAASRAVLELRSIASTVDRECDLEPIRERMTPMPLPR